MARNQILIDDGIIVWFEGPEWDDVAEAVFEKAAQEVESYAKDNAPWNDITGSARGGLQAKAESSNGDIVLSLEHTVDYGLWLEVIQNGKFAIIMPTLESRAPEIMAQAVEEIARARRGR
jgi:hypothetical protein